jgi:predicted PurR-regulated permease PerM
MPDTSIEASSTTASSASLKIIATAIVLTCIYVASSILITLICSLFIAFILDPGVVLLERLRLPRWLASLIMVLLALALIYLLVYLAYDRLIAFVSVLPKVMARVQQFIAYLEEFIRNFGQTGRPAASPPHPDAGPTFPASQASPWLQYLARGLGPLYEFAVTVLFIPFLVFFMLTSKAHLLVNTLNLFHVRRRHKAEAVITGIGHMVRSYVLGNLLVALISAALLTPLFAAIGLRFSLILGPLAAFLTLVPYLGVVLSLIPPMLIALLQFDRPGPFVAITFAVLVVHFLAINVLTPKLVGHSVKLNPLTVTISMLFWGWLWGAIGLVLSVPITAAVKAICDNIPSLQKIGAWMGEG